MKLEELGRTRRKKASDAPMNPWEQSMCVARGPGQWFSNIRAPENNLVVVRIEISRALSIHSDQVTV